MRWILRFAAVVVGVACLGATAQQDAQNSARQLFQERWADHLPEYCLYTHLLPDNNYSPFWKTPVADDYEKVFGGAWPHLHHYCFGLDDVFEASSIEDDAQRKSMYAVAITEFDYVLQRSSDRFVLKPEIYVEKAAAQEMVGEMIGAVDSYTRAIDLNSDYEPAYIGLSHYFEDMGDPHQARTIVEAALKQLPASDTLRERRDELISRYGVVP